MRRTIAQALFIALAALLAPAMVMANGVRVQVHMQSEVQGNRFTLGEIASIEDAAPELAQRLANLPVGRSPRPGGSLRVHHSSIASQLTRELGPAGFNLEVPAGAAVSRASRYFSGEEIGELVRAHALKGKEGEGTSLEIETRIRDAHLPVGDIRWEIRAQGRQMARGGSRAYRVVAYVNGRSQWNALVRTRTEVVRKVVVAVRPIARGANITAEDIRVEQRRVDGRLPGSTLGDVESVVGKPALRPIARNELINASMVREPLSVREGGRVTLLYQGPGVQFTAVGVALVNGRVGKFIPVRNLQSGKIVYGVVKEEEVVLVN